MAVMLKPTAMFLLLGFLSFGTTLGNSVSLSMSSQTGNVGEPLELTCLLNPSAGASITAVNWFPDSDTTGIQLSAAACSLVGPAPSYDLARYSFTCSSSSNTFKLTILALQNSDDGKCWSCSVKFSNFPETDKASSACIKLKTTPSAPVMEPKSANLPLLLILLILLPVSIFVILIVCGCLDCCKCCRIFDHYDEKKWSYVTCYCLTRGCCSFFCCRPGRKKGKCLCGDKKGSCGGCNSCQIKCACGWPDLFKSKDRISCGCCSYICCVQGIEYQGLDKPSMAMTGPPALYTDNKNKFHPLATNLPPLKEVTSDETVELKEPRMKKKKKNRHKLDRLSRKSSKKKLSRRSRYSRRKA